MYTFFWPCFLNMYGVKMKPDANLMKEIWHTYNSDLLTALLSYCPIPISHTNPLQSLLHYIHELFYIVFLFYTHLQQNPVSSVLHLVYHIKLTLHLHIISVPFMSFDICSFSSSLPMRTLTATSSNIRINCSSPNNIQPLGPKHISPSISRFKLMILLLHHYIVQSRLLLPSSHLLYGKTTWIHIKCFLVWGAKCKINCLKMSNTHFQYSSHFLSAKF